MKQIITFFFLFVIINYLHSQPSTLKKQQLIKPKKNISETDCVIDYNYLCDWDLRSPLVNPTTIHTPATDGSEDIVYGISNAHYKDAQYEEELSYNCNAFAANTCVDDNYATTLRYSTYYPSTYDFVHCPSLPAIIFVHGGGFSECSSFMLNNTTGIGKLAVELSARGYVVFTVEYRRGRELDGNGTVLKSVQQQLTGYRIAQDVRGAIRSIIKRQLNEGTPGINDPYRIDIEKLFLAGNSGGSLAVLSAYFYQTQYVIDQVFPHASGSSVTIGDALDNINAPLYYADKNNSLYDYFSRIKGILNLWSGLYIPNSLNVDADFDDLFNSINVPPIISFVGDNDGVFPPDDNPINFSPYTTGHYKYNKANYDLITPDFNDCTIGNVQYQLNTNAGTIDLHFFGARRLYQLLQYQNVLSELYVDCQAHHGLTNSGSSYLCDYGTGATNDASVYTYIAERATTFFQLCLDGITTKAGGPTTTLFIESENNRNTCILDDDVSIICEACTTVSTDGACYNPDK